MMKTMTKALATALAVVMMSGCMSSQSNTTGFGADAMGRTIPERISDTSIELTARRNLSTIAGINENNVRIAIDSFRREVLLTGEVPNDTIKSEVARTIESMKDVEKVFNYLTVTDTPKSQSHTMHENYLRSKIVSRVLTSRGVKAAQYKVIVRDRTAYVMGYMTPEQQNQILQAIQATSGMEAAVTLTTLVNDAQLSAMPADTSYAPETQSYPQDPSVAQGGYDGANGDYQLQEIYTPEANSQMPSNSAPVMNEF